MANGKLNNVNNDIKDKYGDFNADAPNPTNTNPQFMGDYPPPKTTTSKIPEISPCVENNNESLVTNHPPKPPGDTLGPYILFISTDLKKMLWMGSVLIFRHVSYDRPNVEFISDTQIDYNWEILYENLFDMRAYRVNLFIKIRPGEGDDKIIWKIDWGNKTTEDAFIIARSDQQWRGGFFSCNGFDAYVPDEVVLNLTHSNVWNHLLSVHEETTITSIIVGW